MAPKPYPSIALGVFEATPMEIAAAYTVFAGGGEMHPLRAIARLESGGDELPLRAAAPARIARADTTFLVTSMLRSVINEGTAASARGMGFSHDAAGKTGTTNDLRDAWFVGFTPELLTAVWVGFDDNQPVGLSGSQAALPIWTRFMMAALAGRPNVSFAAPSGIVFVDDRSRHRQARPARLPASPQRGLPRRNRAHRGVRAAPVLSATRRRGSSGRDAAVSPRERLSLAFSARSRYNPPVHEAVFAAALRALERGEEAALVTIVSTQGSTPQRVGARMLVYADGRTVGTIGGGCYENDAAGKARESLRTQEGRHRALRPERRAGRGERADLWRADGRLHRTAGPVASTCSSSGPAT